MYRNGTYIKTYKTLDNGMGSDMRQQDINKRQGYTATQEQQKLITRIIKRSRDRANTGYAIRTLMLSEQPDKTKALQRMLKVCHK